MLWNKARRFASVLEFAEIRPATPPGGTWPTSMSTESRHAP
ncbi:DUF1589 domain-containing protein [Rhodopirellula baltica]